MSWYIQCSNHDCKGVTIASQIVDLIENHTNESGWIKCNICGKNGYIKKSFNLQEGNTWKPFLRGIIPLGEEGATYQPFVFLVSYKPNSPIKDVWFSYYKDLREEGGNLKLGYGPGGPPVLGKSDLLILLGRLIDLNCLSIDSIKELVKEKETI
jgi:hypothetical protein